MIMQIFRFAGVGVSALIVHWCVVLILVPLGLAPLWANVVGFMVAFNVSYFGHRHFTFQAAGVSHRQTFVRFAGVALASFLVNEAMYAALLTFTSLSYDIALLIVLGVVAVMTFVLSRLWAFAS